MADVVKFVLELTDKVSPAGKKVQQSLTGVRASLAKLLPVNVKGGKAAEQAGMGALKMAKGFIAANVAMKAFEVAKSLPTMFAGAQAFKEQSQFALGILLKSGAEGKRVYDQILRMSQFFGEDPTETMKSFQTLLSKGFKTDDAIKTMQVLGDLKLTAPDANMESLVRAMGQIKSKPKLALEELKTQLGDAGLDLGLAYDEIGKLIGKKATDVEKAISAGQVDSSTGLLGIMNAIMRSSGSKAAGEQMEKFSKTTTGLAKTLSHLPDQYMLRLNVEGGAMQKVLKTLVDTLDPASPTGQKILGFLEKLGADFAGWVSSVDVDALAASLDDMADSLMSIRDAAIDTKNAFYAVYTPASKMGTLFGSSTGSTVSFAKAISLVGTALGAIVGVLAAVGSSLLNNFVLVMPRLLESGKAAFSADAWNKLLGNFMDTWDGLSTWFGDLTDSAWDWGADIVDGIWNGLKSTWKGMIEKVKALVDLLPEAVKKTLGIASPSKVFMQLGRYSMEGFEKGVNDNAGGIQSAVTTAVAAPAAVGAAAGKGGSVSWSGNVIVQVTGSTDKPGELGNSIGVAVANHVSAIFEGLVSERGVAA